MNDALFAFWLRALQAAALAWTVVLFLRRDGWALFLVSGVIILLALLLAL